MAEPPVAEDGVEEGQVQKKKYLNEQAQGLEKVTDYVEEQDISGLQNVYENKCLYRALLHSPYYLCALLLGSDQY